MEIRQYFVVLPLALFAVLLLSCKDVKQCDGASNSDEMEVDDDQEAESDTLVYEVSDAPLPEAVDESFLDFFYTFLNRKGFQSERTAYPVEVKSRDGQVKEVLNNGRSVREAVGSLHNDYIVMILDENQDPYDYLALQVDHVEVKKVTLHTGLCHSYSFDRRQDGWMFTGIHEEGGAEKAAFVSFLNHFVTDSIYRDDHLADEIFLTIPSDEDDMEVIDGNISPDQWSVFAPEMPHDTMLLLEMGNAAFDDNSVKMVKCDLASSMLEVLTFKKEGDEWKLVRYEE